MEKSVLLLILFKGFFISLTIIIIYKQLIGSLQGKLEQLQWILYRVKLLWLAGFQIDNEIMKQLVEIYKAK